MPRLRLPLRVAVPSALAVLATLLGACTGSGDPTSPVQPGAEGSYVHAKFTLEDTSTPCRPGVVCDPEFFDCDGIVGYTIPHQWTLDADEASVGVSGYNPSVGGSDARGVLIVRATDTAEDTAVSFAIDIVISNATGAVTAAPSAATTSIFANVDARCTRLNASNDAVTLFAVLTAQPRTATIDALGVNAGEIAFAEADGAGLTPDFVEGTFSFHAENRQEFGRVYVGRILVEGCFRVQIPHVERGVALDPTATPGCN